MIAFSMGDINVLSKNEFTKLIIFHKTHKTIISHPNKLSE